MSLATTDAVRGVFQRAVQEHLQKVLRTSDDWDRFNAIRRETDDRLTAEDTAFALDFSQRMAEAKEIILREENGVRLDQPLPPWAERHSDADGLDRKAGERVRLDHQRRCAAITKDEMHAFRDLTAEIRARDAPTQAFTRAQDRSQDRSPTRPGPTRNQ